MAPIFGGEQQAQEPLAAERERDRNTQYFEVELDKKKAVLTHDGIGEAQKIAGVGSFYVGENIDLPHLPGNQAAQFWEVMIIMAIIVVAMLVYFRRKRWI